MTENILLPAIEARKLSEKKTETIDDAIRKINMNIQNNLRFTYVYMLPDDLQVFIDKGYTVKQVDPALHGSNFCIEW